MKGLSGGVGDGRCWIAATARKTSFVLISKGTFSCLWQAQNQPIVAAVCILVNLAPCTVCSILHGETIEVRWHDISHF